MSFKNLVSILAAPRLKVRNQKKIVLNLPYRFWGLTSSVGFVAETGMGTDYYGAPQSSAHDVPDSVGMVQEHGGPLWHGISCQFDYSLTEDSPE